MRNDLFSFAPNTLGKDNMNSFMSWVGGKKALREEIVSRLNQKCDRYVEVFGGGGWVLFHKPPGKFEVYNDFQLQSLQSVSLCESPPHRTVRGAPIYPQFPRGFLVYTADPSQQRRDLRYQTCGALLSDYKAELCLRNLPTTLSRGASVKQIKGLDYRS